MNTFSTFKDPVVALSNWSVYEVPLQGLDAPWTRHLVGFDEDLGLAQVSSALLHFSPESRLGTATSGRLFQLVGESGRETRSAAMWARWKLLNRVTQERDVTAAIHKVLLAWQGSAVA